MASTSTTTPSPVLKTTDGFTLVEVMISSVLATIILSAVLSMFLFLGRSSANIINYAEMESQARRGLEFFAQDTRQSSDLVLNSTSSVTLTVGASTITYAFDSSTGDFTRTMGGVTSVLLEGITTFTFSGYKITGATVDTSDLSTAAKRDAAGGVTKQIQIYIEVARNSVTAVQATNTVLSARYILRNKRVTA
ncbi:prepilin-type N-terminal cleavage/methylation domain-containing protein [Opitutaceae bacterium]|nr:prepilin-type N-terminal cleavage/methylation domain-containing protein [Opitutaceae bacterium]